MYLSKMRYPNFWKYTWISFSKWPCFLSVVSKTVTRYILWDTMDLVNHVWHKNSPASSLLVQLFLSLEQQQRSLHQWCTTLVWTCFTVYSHCRTWKHIKAKVGKTSSRLSSKSFRSQEPDRKVASIYVFISTDSFPCTGAIRSFKVWELS